MTDDVVAETVAVVVAVPEDQFCEDDELCHTAGRYVCQQLRAVLCDRGHEIPEWCLEGIEEDYGTYFESRAGKQTFSFHIAFFPKPSGQIQDQMMVQYGVRRTLVQNLLGKSVKLPADHSLHDAMKVFAQAFTHCRTLTQTQLEQEF